MSFSSNWGYGDKEKDESFSPPPRTLNTSKICELEVSPEFAAILKNEFTSYTLSISGDWEADSAYIASRFVLHSAYNACHFFAFPSNEIQKDVLIIAPGVDASALAAHQLSLNHLQAQISQQLGIHLQRAVGDGGWVPDGSMHLPSALLFSVTSHLMLGRWFRIILEEHPEALCIGTKFAGQHQKYDADVDVIAFDAISLVNTDSKTSILRICFRTFVYRLLSAQPILKLGLELERPLYNMQSKTDPVSMSKVCEAARESLRVMRAGQPLTGLHDAQAYEFNLGKAISILHHEGFSQAVVAPSVKDDGFVTEFEKRMQQLGYLSYLPANASEYCRYWHLRCGSGLSSGPGFPQLASLSNAPNTPTSKKQGPGSSMRGGPDRQQRQQWIDSQDSMDSQDSLDSMNLFEDSSAAAPTTPREEPESNVVEAQLRVAPVPAAEYAPSGKQCSTQLLPRSLVTGGVCEIPYLTRTKAEQAAASLRQDMKQCSMVAKVLPVEAPPLSLPFPLAAAGEVMVNASASASTRNAAQWISSNSAPMVLKFAPASALRRLA